MSKLVRDKIPKIIKNSGKEPITHIEIDDKVILELLRDKLIEEANEVKCANSSGNIILELVDVYEVMISIGRLYGVSIQNIQQFAKMKREQRGGFTKMIVLDDVISKESIQ